MKFGSINDSHDDIWRFLRSALFFGTDSRSCKFRGRGQNGCILKDPYVNTGKSVAKSSIPRSSNDNQFKPLPFFYPITAASKTAITTGNGRSVLKDKCTINSIPRRVYLLCPPTHAISKQVWGQSPMVRKFEKTKKVTLSSRILNSLVGAELV